MYAFSTLAKRTTPFTEPSSLTVLARFGVPQNMVSVIRQIQDGMRACVWVTTGCAWGSLLWNKAFARVRAHAPPVQHPVRGGYKYEAYTRFKASKDIMDALVHLRKKNEAGGRRQAAAGELVLTMPLDDAGGVSHFPKQPRKMMGIPWSCARGLVSSYRRPRLRSCAYARRRCRNPPPHSA